MALAGQSLCQVLSGFEPPHPHLGVDLAPEKGFVLPPPGLEMYAAPQIFPDDYRHSDPFNEYSQQNIRTVKNGLFNDIVATDYNLLNKTQTQQVSIVNHSEDEDHQWEMRWEKAVSEALMEMSEEVQQTNGRLSSATPGGPRIGSVGASEQDNSNINLLSAEEQANNPQQNAQLEPNDQSAQKAERKKGKPSRPNAQPAQWWRDCPMEQVCPLSGFPICLLPYPPFKFRQDPNRPEHFELVDGKYLVLQAIACARFEACGRPLLRSDVNALDTYIRRCNLGPLRPGSAAELKQVASHAPTPEERAAAEQELNKLQERAKSEWKRLQRIQDQRMSEIWKRQQAASASETLNSGVHQDRSMPQSQNSYFTMQNYRNSGSLSFASEDTDRYCAMGQ